MKGLLAVFCKPQTTSPTRTTHQADLCLLSLPVSNWRHFHEPFVWNNFQRGKKPHCQVLTGTNLSSSTWKPGLERDLSFYSLLQVGREHPSLIRISAYFYPGIHTQRKSRANPLPVGFMQRLIDSCPSIV